MIFKNITMMIALTFSLGAIADHHADTTYEGFKKSFEKAEYTWVYLWQSFCQNLRPQMFQMEMNMIFIRTNTTAGIDLHGHGSTHHIS